MYEHFEHTADLGLRVRAPDLNALFADAAEGLTAAIVEDVNAIEPRQEVRFSMSGSEHCVSAASIGVNAVAPEI